MVKIYERTSNTITETTIKEGIEINSNTSTKVLDANDLTSPRLYYTINNPSNHNCWIKEQSADTDDDKKGIPLPKRSFYTSEVDTLYIGEICVISESGTPKVYVTEY